MQPKILTATGVIKSTSGNLAKVCITTPGTGASTVTIYDNATTNTGTVLFQGDGLVEADFDLTVGGNGLQAKNGMYAVLTGTAKPTIEVEYS